MTDLWTLARGDGPVIINVPHAGTFIPAAIADDLFSRADASPPIELLQTLNYICQIAPSYSLRGGTRDILRGMIARGLGLR